MKRLVCYISLICIILTLFTACASKPNTQYTALVSDFSDAAGYTDCSNEFDFADQEKYSSFVPQDLSNISFNGKSYPVNLREDILYRNSNYFPEADYSSTDKGKATFHIDEHGNLTFAFIIPSGVETTVLSHSECLDIAKKLAQQHFDTSDYKCEIDTEVKNVNEMDYYNITFKKYIGNFETTDSARIAVFTNGEILCFTSTMLGRIPTDTKTDDIYLNAVEAAAMTRLDEIFARAKTVFDEVNYLPQSAILTILSDGSRAIIYTVSVEFKEYDASHEYFNLMGELVEFVIPIPD